MYKTTPFCFNPKFFRDINFILKRSLYKTHYEILKLPRNCSSEDIKKSFIEITKQQHPDRSGGQETEPGGYRRVVEAYGVLRRPLTRRLYDLSLSPFNAPGAARFTETAAETDREIIQRAWADPSFYKNRKIRKDGEPKPYYGVPGINKQTNLLIVLLCIAVSAVGATVQGFIIWSAYWRRKQISDNNRMLLNNLEESTSAISLSDQLLVMSSPPPASPNETFEML